MAATMLMPIHKEKRKSVAASIKRALDYIENPAKTAGGELVRSYGCEVETAVEEFNLSHEEYRRNTGRETKNGVLVYQIRQAFLPGEITPEEANRIGYETAMRFTNGNHAFVVSTHIDRAHIHNHIVFNAVEMDCQRKFRNYWQSSQALRKLSDLLCMENKLSVIEPSPEDPGKLFTRDDRKSFRETIREDITEILEAKPATFREFKEALRERGYVIKEGKHLALRGKEQQRFIRLDSLGEGFTEAELRAKFPEEEPVRKAEKKWKDRKDGLHKLIDIEAKLAEGKGGGYEQWAHVFNVKQMAKTLVFAKENNITSYEDLVRQAERAVDLFNGTMEKIKEKQARLDEIDELKEAIFSYVNTRDVFLEYKAAHYSEKFLEEHRAEITEYREATAAFKKLGVNGKLPKAKDLNQEFGQIISEKKKLYQLYHEEKDLMVELLTAKKNVETMLDIVDAKELNPRKWEQNVDKERKAEEKEIGR